MCIYNILELNVNDVPVQNCYLSMAEISIGNCIRCLVVKKLKDFKDGRDSRNLEHPEQTLNYINSILTTNLTTLHEIVIE